MPPRVIPLSRTKTIRMVLLSAAFVLGGAVMLRFQPLGSGSGAAALFIRHGLGWVCVSFFGLCAVVGALKLLQQAPGLVLDAYGLHDRSSAFPAGRVPWSDITGFGTFGHGNARVLVVKVADVAAYSRRGGMLRRALNRANVGLCGSPVCIAPNTLAIGFDELHAACAAWHAQRRGSRP